MSVHDAHFPDRLETDRNEERIDSGDADALVGEANAQIFDIDVLGQILSQEIIEILLGQRQAQCVQFHPSVPRFNPNFFVFLRFFTRFVAILPLF